MGRPHGDNHPPDAAGVRALAGEPGPVQQFYAGTFMQAQFAQALPVRIRDGRPVDRFDIGRGIGSKLGEAHGGNDFR